MVKTMGRPRSNNNRYTLHGYAEAEQAAEYICSQGFAPRVAITLGSGLDEVVGRLQTQVQIPYKRIPHFPVTTVQGHGGSLHLGTWEGVPVAILEGRVHC